MFVGKLHFSDNDVIKTLWKCNAFTAVGSKYDINSHDRPTVVRASIHGIVLLPRFWHRFHLTFIQCFIVFLYIPLCRCICFVFRQWFYNVVGCLIGEILNDDDTIVQPDAQRRHPVSVDKPWLVSGPAEAELA